MLIIIVPFSEHIYLNNYNKTLIIFYKMFIMYQSSNKYVRKTMIIINNILNYKWAYDWFYECLLINILLY